MSPPNGVSLNNDDKYLPVAASPPQYEGSPQNPEASKAEEENELPDENDTGEEAEIVVPPDGGWGWVVVFASFMCNMIVDGIIFSFGIMMPKIGNTFSVGKAEVSLIGSLMSGFYLMTGPFASALANRYGFRLVAISGSILGAAAFLLSYFATSVSYLYFSYGFLGGKFHRNRHQKKILGIKMMHLHSYFKFYFLP